MIIMKKKPFFTNKAYRKCFFAKLEKQVMSTCYKILDQSLPHFLKLQLVDGKQNLIRLVSQLQAAWILRRRHSLRLTGP